MRSFLEKGYGWPLFVVLLLVSSVAMMGIVVMAARSDGGAQVIDDYYEQAVRWDSLADARSAAAAMGWQTDLVLTGTEQGLEGVVTLADSMGVGLGGRTLSVKLRRPQLATVIAEMNASESDEDGTYTFTTDARGAGLWDIQVDVLPSADTDQLVRLDWRREVR